MRILATFALAFVLAAPAALAQQPPAGSTRSRQQLEQKLAERDRLQRDIDDLKLAIGLADQVVLRVMVVEVSLTDACPLGFDPVRFTLSKPADGAADEPAAGEPGTYCIHHRSDMETILDSLRQLSVLRKVAETSLVIRDGNAGNCFDGFNLPYPIVTDDGKQSTEFLRFGTEFEATVTLVGQHKAQLQFAAKLSNIDPASQADLAKHKVPGMQLRTFSANCEVAFDHTIALAGRTQTRVEKERVNTVPLLGISKDRTKQNNLQVYYLVTVHPITTAETAKSPAPQSNVK